MNAFGPQTPLTKSEIALRDMLYRCNNRDPLAPAATISAPTGVWMAIAYEGGECVPFLEEVDALRFDVSGRDYKVKFVKFGEPAPQV